MSTANVWAYSHYENTDVETFCISAVKASMLGCHVITAPNGALPEVVPNATFVPNQADYAQTVIEAIKNPISDQQRIDQFKAGAERFDWNVVADAFSEVWTVKPK
jgi:glycosyltransferase involved in cell wall biosynthesis